MIRSSRWFLAPLLALVLIAAAGLPVAGATAAPLRHSLLCDGNLGRSYTYVHVTSGLVGSGTPLNVTVTRPYAGGTVISSPRPKLENGVDGGYWWRTYHWNSWNLGLANGTDPIYLQMPPVISPGSSFNGQLYWIFAAGGNWQVPLTCTAS